MRSTIVCFIVAINLLIVSLNFILINIDPVESNDDLFPDPLASALRTFAPSTAITTSSELQNISNDLTGDYHLANDIDCTATLGWNGGAGFDPIGNNSGAYTGTFDGRGFTIKNLTIDRPSTQRVGLFGYVNSTSTIFNATLSNVHVNGSKYTGGLVGYNNGGTIFNSSVEGSVVSNSSFIGGLVGLNTNNGLIENSRTDVYVEAFSTAGCLVGQNGEFLSDASVSNSSGKGTAKGIIADFNFPHDIAGFAGVNFGNISLSRSNAIVSGEYLIGGFVGSVPKGNITNAFSKGTVAGNNHVGGFAGNLVNDPELHRCGSIAAVTGTASSFRIGGFVGYTAGSGQKNPTINNSYAGGDVSGVDRVGGFGGEMAGATQTNYVYRSGKISGSTQTGGFLGSRGGTATFFECLWDNTTAGQSQDVGSGSNSGIDSMIKFDMMNPAKYAGWDFNIVGDGAIGYWIMAGYPHLQFEQTPMITNAVELQLIAVDLGAFYALINNITFPYTDNWNAGKGFRSVGTSVNKFTGTFNGNNHQIKTLKNWDSGINGVGLFGYTDSSAIIRDLKLLSSDVIGNSNVGALVGASYGGTIDNCYSSGNVSGDSDIGGLVGYAEGTKIINSGSASAVGGSDSAGGLVGSLFNSGYINNSYATGTVNATTDNLGGLVGYCWNSIINNSYSTGGVGGNINDVGGLVGYNNGIIKNCYATGTVYGAWYAGGLVGWNDKTIINSSSSGTVTGKGGNNGGLVGRNSGGTITDSSSNSDVWANSKNIVGGLVGWNSGPIDNCYATGSVLGDQNIGGLVGSNGNTITNSYSTGTVTAASNFAGGLVGENTETPSSMVNCHSTSNVNGFAYAGGLVGRNYITIYDSWSSGAVTATGSWVGGLLGYNGDIVSNCTSNSSVQGDQHVGGLVGFQFSGATIDRSYSTGRVNGSINVGGLVGYVVGISSTITISYSMSNVSGTSSVGGLVGRFDGFSMNNTYSQGNVSGSSSFIGGLIGLLEAGTVNNSYSSGKVSGLPSSGGFVGNSSGGTVVNSFWDKDTSGRTNSVGGTGKTTAEMKTKSTFTGSGWNFTTIWGIAEGKTYPFFLYWYEPASLISLSIPAAVEDQFYSTQVNGKFSSYPQGYTPSWSMETNAGSWLSVDSDGILSGTPSNADVGTFWVNITITGAMGDVDSRNFTLTVSNVNDPPNIITGDDPNALEDILYTIDYNATDIDPPGDTLTWSLNTNAGWLSIFAGSGVVFGTPTNSDVGSYWVNVSVTDNKGGFDSTNFTLTVQNVNDPPQITNTNNETANEDALYSVTYAAADIDPPGDILTWSFATNASSWLTFNAGTLVLSGTPSNADVGVYWVNITVSDGNGGLDATNFTLTVNNVNDDPIITIADVITATEDVLYSVDYDAADEDPTGDTFTWGITTTATWLIINGATGVLSGTPKNADVGNWLITVIVADGSGGSDSSSFIINVTNVNDPPVIDKSGIPSGTMEDMGFYEDFNATDIDPTSDTLTWALETDGLWLGIDTVTGELTGTPTNANVGSYWVNVSVEDGNGGEDYHNFSLLVFNINDAPVMISADVLTAKAGEQYSVDYNATDVDPTGDTLTWSLETNASSWLSIIPSTGLLSGTPEDADAGSYNVKVTVSDGNGGSDYTEFILVVKLGEVFPDDNLIPVITTFDVHTAPVNETYSVDYNATDDRTPESELVWSMKTNATWLSLNSGTGVLSGTPTLSDVGGYRVVITVSDGEGGLAERNFTISVPYPTLKPPVPFNVKPILSNGKMTPASGDTDTTFTFIVDYFDEDGNAPVTIVVVIDGTEHEMELVEGDASDGTYRYETTMGEGTHTYNFKVSDGPNDADPTVTLSTPEITLAEPEEKDDKEDEGANVLYYLLPIIMFVIFLLLAVAVMKRGQVKAKGEVGKTDAECYKCGAIVPAEASSCPECGTEFESEEEDQGSEE